LFRQTDGFGFVASRGAIFNADFHWRLLWGKNTGDRGEKEEWREQEVEGEVDVSAFRPPSPIFSKAALPFDLSYSMLRARFVKEDRYGLA